MAYSDDNELMDRVKQGEKPAYEELVERHYHAGVVFACQIVRDYHMAEDIVQECFARIYLMRSRYKPSFTFKTYLFTVIRNQSVDYLRKQKKLATADWSESAVAVSGQQVEDVLIDGEEKKDLYRHIRGLKEEHRQLLYLYAIEELSYKEIARITGQSAGQVKAKLFRCRQTLKSRMGEENQSERKRKNHERNLAKG